jgi:2-hydroxy-6-oxonona-2,4-dienedioate hydrolase
MVGDQGEIAPSLVLFHGGMGSWKHWIRDLDALAGRFRVHAVDLPGYGAAAMVDKSLPRQAYVDLVVRELQSIVGSESFCLARFSFAVESVNALRHSD